MRKFPLIAAMTLGLAASAILSTPAKAASFEEGDVFASVASGSYQQWREVAGTWTLVDTLTTGLGGFTTGSTFSSTGDLYGTNFSHGSVSKFLGPGTPHTHSVFSSPLSTPESILFDLSGNLYVGTLGSGLQRIDATTGAVLQTYSTGRVDWIDLAADQTTMLFTTEAQTVFRFDLTTDSFLTDFAALPGPGEGFALRILSDGGVLVADGDEIKRLNSSGTVIQTYDTSGNDSWFALNLDPDGTTFWSGDFSSADVVRFDIATGAVVDSFNTGTGSSTLFGLSVFGEITVGGGGPIGGATVPLPPAGLAGIGLLGLMAAVRRVRRRR